MEASETGICLGCLCTDRKVIVLDNVVEKQCFLRLIWEISAVPVATVAVSLCWECDALLRRFTKFKIQVQKSYRMLQNYVGQATHTEKHSNMLIQKQFNLNILPTDNDGELESPYCEIIKSETCDNNIKKEILENVSDNELSEFKHKVHNESTNDVCDTLEKVDYSDNYSDDDNKLLIELKKKGKKHSTTKKKRKKKEKITNGVDFRIEIEYYKEIDLTAEEIEKERRSLELSEDYVNALFKCERCIISFPNADDLTDHINIKHEMNATAYKCNVCECTFASEVAFNYHSNKHTRRFQCLVCSERLPSKRAAVKHYENTHCARTQLEYDFNRSLDKNQKLNGESVNSKNEGTAASYPCESCNKTFRWKTSLRKHAETHRIEAGQKRRPYCEPCRLSFTTTSNLQKHVKTSSKHQIQLKLRKLKESLPEDATSEKQAARIEQIKSSVVEARQLFPCGQCDKRFQWRGNLLRHMHSHAARARGELVCAPCNRSFSSIATYKQHLAISRKHVSEDDFKFTCSECGKRFANKTRLKDHVDWEHLKNYVHQCPVCQKIFKSHTSLYLHKQVVHHKDGAEHLCDHCGKPFPNRAKLRAHIIALHSAGAPYACPSCGARFSWHSCLSRHVRSVHARAGGRGAPPTRAASAPDTSL